MLQAGRMSNYLLYYFDFTGAYSNAPKHTHRLSETGRKHISEHSQGCNYTCHGEISCDLLGFYFHMWTWIL